MKEASDNIEREFKLDGIEDDLVALCVRRAVPKGCRLGLAHRMIYDIYFDTQNLTLAKTGAALRARSRRFRDGWTLNFKPRASPEHDYLERREVRTSIGVDELILFRTSGFPGKAGALASDWLLQNTGRREPIRPVLVLISARRSYTVRPADIEDFPNLLVDVTSENVHAMWVDPNSVKPLIRSRVLDVTHDTACAAFRSVEVEAHGCDPSNLELAGKVSNEMRERGASLIRATKYSQALKRLQESRAPQAAFSLTARGTGPT